MLRFSRSLIAALLCIGSSIAFAQPYGREPTDLYIRRLAGLPPETARGQIEIIDVGHDPMSTMLSIVGNRTRAGWEVSYACAASPQCAKASDHTARTYKLSRLANLKVDQILDRLRAGAEPEDPGRSSNAIGGHLVVKINYRGFHHEYRRTILWGETLGKLEALLAQTGI